MRFLSVALSFLIMASQLFAEERSDRLQIICTGPEVVAVLEQVKPENDVNGENITLAGSDFLTAVQAGGNPPELKGSLSLSYISVPDDLTRDEIFEALDNDKKARDQFDGFIQGANGAPKFVTQLSGNQSVELVIASDNTANLTETYHSSTIETELSCLFGFAFDPAPEEFTARLSMICLEVEEEGLWVFSDTGVINWRYVAPYGHIFIVRQSGPSPTDPHLFVDLESEFLQVKIPDLNMEEYPRMDVLAFRPLKRVLGAMSGEIHYQEVFNKLHYQEAFNSLLEDPKIDRYRYMTIAGAEYRIRRGAHSVRWSLSDDGQSTDDPNQPHELHLLVNNATNNSKRYYEVHDQNGDISKVVSLDCATFLQ
ncbi:hypothetical protein [Ruegeria sp.]|uniref:hypothetical protein n=1 Tax=Ruegeria sp. TaxID=1879320 RepID=UPI003B59B091